MVPDRGELKGDLGFAELSLTASYFDRNVKYEWDNTNYSQWRSLLLHVGDYPASYASYNTGTLQFDDLQRQKQWRWAYEVRLTSQGESKLQWMAGAFYEDVYDWWEYGAKMPGLDEYARLGGGQIPAPVTCADQGFDVACPLAPTDILLLQQVPTTKMKQIAFFGEVTLRPDRQVDDHRRRALVRVRPRSARHLQRAVRPAGR